MRSPREWAARHIDVSVNVPLNRLPERIGEIPRNRQIAVHCAGGYRSSIAASILHQYGITDVIEMAGGLAAWDAASLTLSVRLPLKILTLRKMGGGSKPYVESGTQQQSSVFMPAP